jgi:hypothetical protein
MSFKNGCEAYAQKLLSTNESVKLIMDRALGPRQFPEVEITSSTIVKSMLYFMKEFRSLPPRKVPQDYSGD